MGAIGDESLRSSTGCARDSTKQQTEDKMGTRRSSRAVAWLAAVLLAAGAAMGLMAGTAGAEVIYKNMPARHQFDGAEGFDCCGTSSFGGEVTFSGSNRSSPTITGGPAELRLPDRRQRNL